MLTYDTERVAQVWTKTHRGAPVREAFADFLLVEQGDDSFERVPYVVQVDGTVGFGDPEPVTVEYVEESDLTGEERIDLAVGDSGLGATLVALSIESRVKSYIRRSKSGKAVRVKAYTRFIDVKLLQPNDRVRDRYGKEHTIDRIDGNVARFKGGGLATGKLELVHAADNFRTSAILDRPDEPVVDMPEEVVARAPKGGWGRPSNRTAEQRRADRIAVGEERKRGLMSTDPEYAYEVSKDTLSERSDAEVRSVLTDPKATPDMVRAAKDVLAERVPYPRSGNVRAYTDYQLRESISMLEDAASHPGAFEAQDRVRRLENELVRRSTLAKANKLATKMDVEILGAKAQKVFDEEKRLQAEAALGRETAKALGDKVTTEGGFTFNPRTAAYVEHGFAVAVPGNSKIIKDSDFTGDNAVAAIVEYLDAHHEQLEANGRLQLGGWHDTEHGEVVLDLSEIFEQQIEAMKAGADRDEQAIFDLDSLTEIPTGGTGGRGTYLDLSYDDPSSPPFYMWEEASDG